GFARDGQLSLVEADCAFRVVRVPARDAEVAQGDALAAAVADLTGHAQVGFEAFRRTADVAFVQVREPQIAERRPLAPPVAALAHDCEVLFEEGTRLGRLAGVKGQQPEAADNRALAPPVACAAVDVERAQVTIRRALSLPQRRV